MSPTRPASAGITLAELVQAGIASAVDGDAAVRVTGVRHDSRHVQPGDLFFALRGQVFDGADYSRDAIARGAVAVASATPEALPVPVLRVDDGLVALSRAAQLLYGDPTADLPTVGITGTNGKTTVSSLVESILLAAGRKPAVIGTIGVRGPGGEKPATHTTPMADDLLRLARWAKDTGAGALVLEVSSHALAMHRADGVHYAVAAFTNLSQDHLDFHGDMERYAQAKYRLFDALQPAMAVINVDDAAGARLAAQHPGPMLRCSLRPGVDAEIRVSEHRSERSGLHARVQTPDGEVSLASPLLGLHNLENLLIALGCAIGLGVPASDAAVALASAPGAPGRLERIAHPQDVLVFVDYAHTPDALARVCESLRRVTAGRLLVVFGCGGDRDPGKRPLMGRAVAERADMAVLTSDNPRTEDPVAILADVEPGLQAGGLRPASAATATAGEFLAVVDRRAAIEAAVALAQPGDTLLIAGKGHEDYQILGTTRVAFDDRVVAREAIAAHVGGAS